jgi:hypothetical protein
MAAEAKTKVFVLEEDDEFEEFEIESASDLRVGTPLCARGTPLLRRCRSLARALSLSPSLHARAVGVPLECALPSAPFCARRSVRAPSTRAFLTLRPLFSAPAPPTTTQPHHHLLRPRTDWGNAEIADDDAILWQDDWDDDDIDEDFCNQLRAQLAKSETAK